MIKLVPLMGLYHIISCSLNVSYVIKYDVPVMGLCHIISCSLKVPMSYNKLFP